MQERRGHLLDAGRTTTRQQILRARAAGGRSAATLSDPEERTMDASGHDMFGDVPPAVRLQMELIARSSVSPEEALPAVIALIVDGSPAKRAAIVTAITDNDPLREQWERTWVVLRR